MEKMIQQNTIYIVVASLYILTALIMLGIEVNDQIKKLNGRYRQQLLDDQKFQQEKNQAIIQPLIEKYKQEWKQNGIGACITYAKLIEDLESQIQK